MPVRIEELVFKTTIKAEKEDNRLNAFKKQSTAQLDIKQLNESLLQDLITATNEHLAEKNER